jgi:hypothetical protein
MTHGRAHVADLPAAVAIHDVARPVRPLAGAVGSGHCGLAALGTIWVTRSTANKQITGAREQADREIAANREAADREIAASQKQIDTTVGLERRRIASEGYAFHAMMEAAMARVLTEATEAQSIFQSARASPQAVRSRQACAARRRITKSAFPELREACVRYGGRLTTKFLDLECDIDIFAAQVTFENEHFGVHAGFDEQLAVIEEKAKDLREEAAGMARENAVFAETEPQ